MDTYAELLKTYMAVAGSREQVRKDKKVKPDFLPDFGSEAFALLDAKLGLFGSPEAVDLSERSFAALQRYDSGPEPGPRSGTTPTTLSAASTRTWASRSAV
ncbi:hypothetical protein [Streptomyces sp. H27-H5]|uniref:hypothetical protein n=1 Tax=Streptomyces sp. H27-H5 TaxID=2996460 RepID=UPI0022714EA2|nr:hypothetical protein [Streptomyces sp. H27-H5]MCY0962074.1 hypothetical protein [Streptomyces sp. H27-H5]